MTFELVSSADGLEAHLELSQGEPLDEKQPSLEELVLELLQSDAPLTRSSMRAELRVNNQRLGDALRALDARREIRRTPDGWILNDRNPEHGDLFS